MKQISFVTKNRMVFGVFIVSALLASCTPSTSTEQQTSTPETADTTKTPETINKDKPGVFHGVDISKWNGDVVNEIDASDSLSFIICKATEGITEQDPDFATNWKIIRSKKMILGCYHFYIVTDDVSKQASNYTNAVKALGSADMPPIVDIEEASITGNQKVNISQLQQNLLLFLGELEKNVGKKPIIYTDDNFSNKYLLNPAFAGYQLWLADYNGGTKPNLPTTWKDKGCMIWQKNDHFDIHSQALDYDVYTGKLSGLLN